MKSLKKQIRQRYIIFVSASLILFTLVFILVNNHIIEQKNDALMINKSGKQRMLSQNIAKHVLTNYKDIDVLPLQSSKSEILALLDELEASHNFLLASYSEKESNYIIDSLLNKAQIELDKIVEASTKIVNSKESQTMRAEALVVANSEQVFLDTMDALVYEYQMIAENNVKSLQRNYYYLIALSALLLAFGFFYLLMPTIKGLIKKNEDLDKANQILEESKTKLNDNYGQLKKLKTDLELKDRYNQIFMEQAPPSIAMLDNDMKYMAVSQKWKIDYKLEDVDVIGKSHYEVFPEIGDDWKQKHKACLKGAVDICDEFLFVRGDGSKQWIFWNVKPWYISKDEIGGLIMYTGDITHVKEQHQEKIRVEDILKKTTDVARIGTWELDLRTDVYTLSDITRNILKLPKDFVATRKKSLAYYKEGISRKKIVDCFNDLIATGKSFDIEVEMYNQEGDIIWVRDIGQAEFVDGECVRLFGIFQDITSLKTSEIELKRKNELLSFAENITQMGHWQLDCKTNTVKWSSNLYLIMDLDKESSQITPHTFLDLTHPDDKEKVQRHMQRTFEEKMFHSELIHRVITPKGTVKTLEVIGKVFTDQNGEITEIIGSCQDITEQRMEELKFRGLLESAPDAMIILNEQQNIHLINKQAERLFGYAPEEVIDNSIDVLVPKRIVDNFKVYKNNYFVNPEFIGMGDNEELIGITKSGHEFPVQVSLSPVETNEGLLISAAVRDVSIQKQIERSIRDSKENLELLTNKLIKQNVQLADFAQITSHNLRAPVSNLNSLIDIYNMSSEGEEKELVFDKFKKVVTHLTETLNALVEALRIKKEEVTLEEVNFTTTLKMTKDLLAAQIIKTDAIITCDFEECNKISYHKIYLESIFLNLVENAIKYRSKKRSPKIHLSTKVVEGQTILEINDNGLGINLERHKHKLFGLNKVFHRHPEAKGFGLFMTKLQIESLGGTINVKSEVGQGSTFIINFNK
nr:PAS domain S-box protein [uncultured Psychroserpens sp.]